MLLDSAFIFNSNYDYARANIAANISADIKNGEYTFLRDILRRSILQHLANIIAENGEEATVDIFTKKGINVKITEQEAFDLIKYLEGKWDNN